MGVLVWNDRYSVHIESIDNEHKLLIGLVNDLERVMASPDGMRATQVLSALEQFDHQVRLHFASEERFLLLNSYPDYGAHLEQHCHLLATLERFTQGIRARSGIFTEKMLDYLKEWLVHHILQHDSRYGSYFRGQDVGSSYF